MFFAKIFFILNLMSKQKAPFSIVPHPYGYARQKSQNIKEFAWVKDYSEVES